ncbi:hypothetical protein SUGI_0599530 [Cryptomeria japonica]|nr:hypothetical protein SUGI_0599530 [Cryptomeria japonica]
MQSSIQILDAPTRTASALIRPIYLQKWSSCAHGSHTAKGSVPPKRLLQALRRSALPGKLLLKRMPGIRNQADNVPQRRKSGKTTRLFCYVLKLLAHFGCHILSNSTTLWCHLAT